MTLKERIAALEAEVEKLKTEQQGVHYHYHYVYPQAVQPVVYPWQWQVSGDNFSVSDGSPKSGI